MRRAFEAGRRESHDIAVKVTILAGTQVVSQQEARSASALLELQRMADQLADLKQRMHQAMDSIGIAAGAWHCQECGEWTTRNIPHEDTNCCPRCAPIEAGCPF